MSQRIFSIDKTLYEIFSESPNREFRLHELRVEYSSRSIARELPFRKELFWQIYMQIEALKNLKLIRSAYSRPRLPLIPDEACHPFHAKAATPAGCLVRPIETARRGIT